MFDILVDSPIFRNMQSRDIESLLQQHHYQIKKYAGGTVIALCGERCRHIMILLEGMVHGEMLDFTGKVIKIEDIEAPNPLAPAFLFSSKNVFPVDIVAGSDVRILFFQKDVFLEILQSNNIVLNNFLSVISNRAAFLSRKIFFLSFRNIKEKFAQYLLDQSDKNSDIVALPMKQESIAELFGVARPSLSRSIAALVKEGIISMKKNEVRILNKEKLNRYLHH
jgi:CRP/FNR family transcriptional regulator, dissimilatory nitrate respiration regulator